MNSRAQGWFSRGARSSLNIVGGVVAFGCLLLASAAWSAAPDAGAVSSASGAGGVSTYAADASISEPGAPSPDVVTAALGATDAHAAALLAHPKEPRAESESQTLRGPSKAKALAVGPSHQPLVTSATAASASASTTYPLSADGKYYVVNVLRRNYFPPTASATYLNGASLFPYGGPPAAVFDGDDNHFIWQTSTAGDPNAGTVLTVDLGGYFSLGAVRPLYFPLGGPEQYPVSHQVRLATKPNEWTTVVPMTTVSAADSTLSFDATPARYIELTELGAHEGSYGGRLIELFAYPSAQTSPPPVPASGYDLTYFGAVSTVNSDFVPMGTWPQSWPAGAFYSTTPPNGSTGDAVGTVDLGAQYDVSRLSLCFFWSGPGWANGGRLEVAPASGSYNTVYDSGLGNAFTKGVLPCEEYTFPTQPVRYVRATDFFAPGVGVSGGALWSVQAFSNATPRVAYYPLSSDRNYFQVNVARRPTGEIQPTASVTYANGAAAYTPTPLFSNAANAIDGDDLSFNWLSTSGANSTANAALTVDLGQVEPIGAIRQLYGSLRPNSSRLRVAISSAGPWTEVLADTPVSLPDNTTSFAPVSARYVELTMTGTSSVAIVNLDELMVYAGSTAEPAPSSTDNLDLTYLTGLTFQTNANMGSAGSPRLHSVEGATGFYPKAASQGATGDAAVTIDLSQPYPASEVDLSFYSNGTWSNGGKLEVDDGSGNWATIVDSGHGAPLGLVNDSTRRITFTPRMVRYVRITGYYDANVTSSGLLENIAIFASAACAADPVCSGGNAQCSDGIRNGDETDVDCGGSCAACPKAKGCSADADCASGLVCGQSNGACFGQARAARVCWAADCQAGSDVGGCGTPDSACGQNCACVTACDASSASNTCVAGEVCKVGFGSAFATSTPDVCVDVRCPSNDPALCGSPSSVCGATCACTADCSHATCANPSDGCGGTCPGVCKLGDTGCLDDVNCPSGSSCLAGTSGASICRPSSCAFRILAPPLCGASGAVCGDTCPVCTPSCENQRCGVDPVCGQSCGSCSDGTYCSADGQCVAPSSKSLPTVPDGKGGQMPLQPLAPSPTAAVGALKGEFSVTDDGTAAYTIPIEVPPGRAGIEPAVSLVYTSSHQNQDLGVGWHLDGLSKITRCPRSFALDGAAAAIQNDPTDVFCLDGKRLVAVSGTYGWDQAEYRTQVDSFAKIVSHVDQGPGFQLPFVNATVPRAMQGPDYFQVFTKDGRILTFGRTVDSLVLAGSGIRYSWLLNRVEDRSGNSMAVTYTNVSASVIAALVGGQRNLVRPLSISYTGHGSTAGNRLVRFDYESRSDPQVSFFQGGVSSFAADRLSRVTTLVDGLPVKNYHLQYGPAALSQVAQITECAGGDDSTCKAPTKFEYRDEHGFAAPVPFDGADFATAGQLDADGDGVPDFLVNQIKVGDIPADNTLRAAAIATDIAVGVGSQALTPAGAIAVNLIWDALKGPFWGSFGAFSGPPLTVSTQLYFGSTNRSQAFLFGGNASGIRCDVKTDPMFLLDYNQDGRDDILSACDIHEQNLFLALSGSTRGTLTNFPSDGSPVLHRDTPNPGTIGPQMNTSPVIADIDGDGLEDVLQCKDEFTLQLWRRSLPLAGSNFQNMTQGFAPPIELNDPIPKPPGSTGPTLFRPVPFCDQYIPTYKMMDVNGDGTPDLLVQDPNGWFVLEFNAPLDGSPSLSFQPVQFIDVGGGTGSVGGRLALADFNGDGLQDIWSYGNQQDVIVWLNNGNKVFTARQLSKPPGVGFEPNPPSPYQRRTVAVLDYNGDGRSDILEHWEYDTTFDGELFEHNVNNGLLPDSVVQMFSGVDVPELTFRYPEGAVVPASFSTAADIDADGNLDLFGGSGEIFYGSGARNTLLDKVTDGLGNVVNVNYDAVGTYNADSCVGTWPEKCLKTANELVSSHTEGFVSSQGDTVTERTYKYHYFNGHMSTTGHGWLGFDRRTIDFQATVASGSTTTIDFEPLARFTPQGDRTADIKPPYLYPLVGLPKTVTVDVYTDSGPTAVKPPLQSDFFDSRVQTINTWDVQVSSSKLGFPITSNRDVTSYERPVTAGDFLDPIRPAFDDNGVFVSECSDDFQMDGFGNVTADSQSCQFQEGSLESALTTRSYQPDTTSWLISNPTHTEVSSSAATYALRTWDMGYTTTGLLQSVTRARNGSPDQQRTTIYDPDDFGNVLNITEQVRGEPDRITAITYDSDNVFPSTITNAAGQTTQLDFDSKWGEPVSTVDPNGVAVQTSYDAFGREGRSESPTGITITTYSTISNPNTITAIGSIEPRIQVSVEHHGTAGTPDGSNIAEVDNYGRAVRQISTGFGGVNVIQEHPFDALGRSLGQTLPHTADTTPVPFDRYSYDGLRRLARIDHSDGSHREFQYATSASLDPSHSNWTQGMTCSGLPASYCAVGFKLTIDETGRQNAEVADYRGRVIRNIDGNNVANAAQASNYSFGAFGRLVQTSDNRNFATNYQFDDYGRLQSELGPDVGSRVYTYSGFDQLKTMVDPSHALRTYSHDSLGRLTSIVDSAGTTQWIFDQGENGLGRLSQSISPATDANPSGQSVSYNYEPVSANNRALLHSVTYSIDGNNYPVQFDYDDLGRTQNTHYPFSSPDAPIVAQNKYDVSGLLSGVDEVGSGTAKHIWHMDSAYQGQLIQQESFGNGAITNYGYNSARHWLENIQTILGSDQIQSLAYTHYNNGLIETLTSDVSTSIEYTYDPLNRLSGVSPVPPPSPPTVTPYSYDDLGNLTNRAGTITSYRPGQPHLIDSVGNNTYQYNLNGNVSSRAGPDIPGGNQTLTYTPFDLPSTVTTGGETVTIDYSADEERLVRRDPNIISHFIPDLYEHKLDESGNTLEERFRLYAGDRPLGEIIRANGTDRTLYFHADHLGSTTTLSDSNGDVTTQNFDPFGMPLNPTVPAATRVGFTGQEQDGDMGLTDMKGRIFDPLAGRFTSADPVMQAPFWGQGLNRYSYVFNNPVNDTDPSGFDASGYDSSAPGAMLGWGAGVTALAALDGLGGGWSLLSGVLGSGGNASFSLYSGLPGGPRPGGSYSITPTATAKSSAVTPQTVQAKGQNQGGSLARKPPGACDLGMCLAQSTAAAEGASGNPTVSDGTGGGVPTNTPTIIDTLIALAGSEVSAAINIVISVENYRRTWTGENSYRIKAPGVPTTTEGYTPPKNWNGRLARNPNSKAPQYGYPDSSGRVWVPTGTGPAAHGGPHWDVQEPGGGYTNVYPGGKTR